MTSKVLYTRFQNIVTAIGSKKGSRSFSFTLKQAISDRKKVVRKEDKYPTPEQYDNALAFIEGVISKFGETSMKNNFTVSYDSDKRTVTFQLLNMEPSVVVHTVKDAHIIRKKVFLNEVGYRSQFDFAEHLALADYIITQFSNGSNDA